MRMRARPTQRGRVFTLEELAEEWGRKLRFVRALIYERKVLKPLPSSRGRGRTLLVSASEKRRVERCYTGVKQAS